MGVWFRGELDVHHRADDAGHAAERGHARFDRVLLVAVMSSRFLVLARLGQRAGAADNFGDFLGDLGLAHLVAWRVRVSMSWLALSVADFMARC